MKLFDKKDVIKIEEDDLKDAKLSSMEFSDDTTKKRAFIDVLGARLAMKMLFSKKIKADNVYSLYTIQNFLENIDIADIYYEGLRIDVRLVFDRNEIFIPKAHFKYDVYPSVYLILLLQEDFSSVEFLGFFNPEKLDKTKANKEFYFCECDDLIVPKNFNDFFSEFKVINSEISRDNFKKAERLFLSLVDKEIRDEDKFFLFKQLSSSKSLREKMVEFENFEMISKEAVKSGVVAADGVLEIVGSQKVYEQQEKQSVLEKEFMKEILEDEKEINVQEEIILQPNNSIKEETTPNDTKEITPEKTTKNLSAEIAIGDTIVSTAAAVTAAAAATKASILEGSAEIIAEGINAGAELLTEGFKAASADEKSEEIVQDVKPELSLAVETEEIKEAHLDIKPKEILDEEEVEEQTEEENPQEQNQEQAGEETEKQSQDENDFEPEIEAKDTPTEKDILPENKAPEVISEDETKGDEFEIVEEILSDNVDIEEDKGFEIVEDLPFDDEPEEQEQEEKPEEKAFEPFEDKLIEDVDSTEAALSEDVPKQQETVELDIISEPLSVQSETDITEVEPQVAEPELASMDFAMLRESIKLPDEDDFDVNHIPFEVGLDNSIQTTSEETVHEDVIPAAAVQPKPLPEEPVKTEEKIQSKTEEDVSDNLLGALPEISLGDFEEDEKPKPSTYVAKAERAIAEQTYSEPVKEEPQQVSKKEETIDLEDFDFSILENSVIRKTDAVKMTSIDNQQETAETSETKPEPIVKEPEIVETSHKKLEDYAPINSELEEYKDEKEKEVMEKLKSIDSDEDLVNLSDFLPASKSESKPDEMDEFISQIDSALKDIKLSETPDNILDEALKFLEEDTTSKQNEVNVPFTQEPPLQPPLPKIGPPVMVTETPKDDLQFDAFKEPVNQNDTLQVLFKKENPGDELSEELGLDDIVEESGKETKHKDILPSISKDKKMVIAASVASVVLVSFVIGGSIANNNKNNQTILQNNMAAAPVDMQNQQPMDNMQNNMMDPQMQVQQDPLAIPGESSQVEPNRDMGEAVSDAFLSEPVNATISKIAWEIPEDLAYNDAFRKYLQIAGKNLKLNLQNNLLLATEMAYSNKVVVDLMINQDGSVGSEKVIKSSGSKQIDKIVLQSVKETLKYLKIPSSEINTPSVYATLIINF